MMRLLSSRVTMSSKSWARMSTVIVSVLPFVCFISILCRDLSMPSWFIYEEVGASERSLSMLSWFSLVSLFYEEVQVGARDCEM
jgi:hypothetical protein